MEMAEQRVEVRGTSSDAGHLFMDQVHLACCCCCQLLPPSCRVSLLVLWALDSVMAMEKLTCCRLCRLLCDAMQLEQWNIYEHHLLLPLMTTIYGIFRPLPSRTDTSSPISVKWNELFHHELFLFFCFFFEILHWHLPLNWSQAKQNIYLHMYEQIVI